MHFSYLKLETQTEFILLTITLTKHLQLSPKQSQESVGSEVQSVQTWPFTTGTKAQVHPALSSEIRAAVSAQSPVNSSSHNKTIIPNSAFERKALHAG